MNPLHAVRKEIIELGIGIQVLFQPEHSLVLYCIANLAVRVEQITELPRTNRTGFHASRVSAVSRPLDAEGALLHDSLITRPVAQVVRLRIDLLRLSVRLRPVKMASTVGTGGHAVPAADAPVIIDDDDAVRLLPGGLRRAGANAGRIFALLTLNGHIKVIGFGNQGRIVILVRLLEVDPLLPLLETEHRYPVYLRVLGLVILIHAGIFAPSATDAAREVETVAEENARDCLLITHHDRFFIFFSILFFQAFNYLLDLSLVHFL